MKTKLWLSFAVKGQNLGIVIAEAASIEEAVKECTRRGCNPGGEVMAAPISEETFLSAPKEVSDLFTNVQSYVLIQGSELPAYLQPRKLTAKEADKLAKLNNAEFVCKECNDVPQN